MRGSKSAVTAAAVVVALVMAGCGGGSGESSDLALGEEAVVQHANTGDADAATTTTLGVTVVAVRQGTQQELEDGGAGPR